MVASLSKIVLSRPMKQAVSLFGPYLCHYLEIIVTNLSLFQADTTFLQRQLQAQAHMPEDHRHNRRSAHSSGPQTYRQYNPNPAWQDQPHALLGSAQHYDPQVAWQEHCHTMQGRMRSDASQNFGDLQRAFAPHQLQGQQHPGQQWDNQERVYSQAQLQQYPPQALQQLHQQLSYAHPEASYLHQEAAQQPHVSMAGHGQGNPHQQSNPAGFQNRMASPQRSGAVPSLDPATLLQTLERGHGGRGHDALPPQRTVGVNAQQIWPSMPQPLPQDARFQSYDRERMQQQPADVDRAFSQTPYNQAHQHGHAYAHHGEASCESLHIYDTLDS